MNLLITFIVLSIVNVILQTVKSIATVKCGKMIASTINAIAYGLYTFVIVYTNCELDIWLKAGITAVTNFIGVYVVKLIEERMRKDKLWKIEATVPTQYKEAVECDLADRIPMSEIALTNGYTQFLFYCDTQKESKMVKDIVEQYGAKFFVTEQNGIL